MDLRLELVSVPVADVDRANGVGSLSAEEQFAAPAALVQGRWVVGGPDSWVVGYAANSGITHPAIRVERGEPFGLDHVRALMAPRPRRSKCHPRRIADAARQGADVKASFEAGIRKYLETLEGWVGGANGEDSTDRAMATFSTMVGALMLSRAVNDKRLAKRLLQAAAKSVMGLSAGAAQKGQLR